MPVQKSIQWFTPLAHFHMQWSGARETALKSVYCMRLEDLQLCEWWWWNHHGFQSCLPHRGLPCLCNAHAPNFLTSYCCRHHTLLWPRAGMFTCSCVCIHLLPSLNSHVLYNPSVARCATSWDHGARARTIIKCHATKVGNWWAVFKDPMQFQGAWSSSGGAWLKSLLWYLYT